MQIIEIQQNLLKLINDNNLEEFQKIYHSLSQDIIKEVVNQPFMPLKQNLIYSLFYLKSEQLFLQYLEIIQRDIQNINYQDEFKQTILFYCAWDGYSQLLKKLILLGIKQDLQDIHMQTAIFYACKNNRQDYIIEAINQNCNLNITDFNHETPLFYAVYNNHVDVVQILVQNKADLNISNKYGQKVIHIAEKNHFHDIFKILYDAGAEYVRKNKKAAQQELQSEEKNQSEFSQQKSLKSSQRKTITQKKTHKQPFNIMQYQNGDLKQFSFRDFELLKEKYPNLTWLIENPSLISKYNLQEKMQQVIHWKQEASFIMNSLQKFKDYQIFQQPVDPVKLGIPNYFNIIKNPMDYQTIKLKLNQNAYANLEQLKDDILLVYDNCILFNTQYSYIGNIAIKTRDYFLKIFQESKNKKLIQSQEEIEQLLQIEDI